MVLEPGGREVLVPRNDTGNRPTTAIRRAFPGKLKTACPDFLLVAWTEQDGQY